MSANTYAVMGDLGGGKYIVRMYVTGYVVDEEFEAPDVGILANKIDDRITELSKGEAKNIGEQIDDFQTDGHAIPMTAEQGADV